MTSKGWQQRDAKVNWHPYTQQKTTEAPLAITKAYGSKLWDADGKEYLDAISSWWCSIHGHAHPEIIASIHAQMQKLEHVLFGGVTHPPAIELSEKIIEILTPGYSRVFYSDNGSTSIEVAMKMAMQYHLNQGNERQGFVALEGAFHGDTFGAMASSGESIFNGAFAKFLLPIERLAFPTEENIEEVCNHLNRIIEEKKPFAFLFEPLVQGAAGMRIYAPALLDRLSKICREHDVLLIADEIMTGFGRTGKDFASDYLSIQPDIICLSKGLTGGFLPMAATVTHEKIYEAFLSDEVEKAFMHGHTFTANPIGCAAALASISLFQSDHCKSQRHNLYQWNKHYAAELKENPKVYNVGAFGAILRFQLGKNQTFEEDIYGDLRNQIYSFFLDEGVLLRPLGNVIYWLPPYCISEKEMSFLYSKVVKVIDKFGK